MIKNSKKIITLSLALLILVSPAFSYAKEKENKEKREQKNASVQIYSEKRSCLKAFGHLIAPGYIKNKGEVSFSADCRLPFGIKKKMNRHATTTADTVAPVISTVALLTGTSTASVSWKTNEKATSKLYYSLSPLSAGATTTAFVSSTTLKKEHLLSLTGLNASSTYYLKIESTDQSGNTASSSVFTTITH